MFNLKLPYKSPLDSSVVWNPLDQSVFSLRPNSSVLHTATRNEECSRLTALSIPNTQILSAYHVPAGSNIPTLGSCQSNATSTADMCRVYGIVNTSPDSAVRFELWLPDVWYGRFLEVGNHALSGCIDYLNVDYGATLHFATIGTDNGHDGNTGVHFLNHPEVIIDFAHRAIHTGALIGKQISEEYYHAVHSKSYYLGCSTGGRQGFQSALLYPEDFDGILGGAPAVDFNHLILLGGLLGTYVGSLDPENSPSFIPRPLWTVISEEILRQCDGLDGLMDGIITEPDDCDFRPEVLLCVEDTQEDCLTQPQVEALHKIYKPTYGTKGQLIYPRYDPGAEVDFKRSYRYFGGSFCPLAQDWMRYTIYNDSTRSLADFGISSIEHANSINPRGIASFNGDISRFRDRGGKFLTYHGRRDASIPSGISKRLYELVSSTLGPQNMDDFYRLFLIPGMDHCAGGGHWAFGQGMAGVLSNRVNDTAHNILLAMVEWVENGIPPSSIKGTNIKMEERIHCLYPQKSIWSGTDWTCVLP